MGWFPVFYLCFFFNGSILFSLWIMNQHFPRAMCCFFCWFPLQVFLWFCPGNSVSPFAVNKTNCRGILTNSTFPWARESQVIAKETVQFCVSSSLEFFSCELSPFCRSKPNGTNIGDMRCVRFWLRTILEIRMGPYMYIHLPGIP